MLALWRGAGLHSQSMPITPLVALLACAGFSAPSVEVLEQSGTIIVHMREGVEVQLTKSGLDFAPTLSPDGRRVAFVRHTPGETVRVGWGDAEAREIWVIDVDGKNPKLLVRGAEREPWEDTLAKLDHPAFLSDGKRIVFDSALAAVDGTINIVDVETGVVTRVSGGNSVEVVRTGPYRDHLIARRHRYFRGGGSYDYFWLVTLDGEVIGPIGCDDTDVTRFKAAFVSSPATTPTEPFKWACDELRGQVYDRLGEVCGEAPATVPVDPQEPAAATR